MASVPGNLIDGRTGRLLAVAVALSLGASIGWGAAVPQLQDPVTGATTALRTETAATHLVFFATWCPACRDELAGLERLQQRWSDRGYRLILVAVQNRHSRDRLARFIEESRPPGRLLFDVAGDAQARWSADSLPTHLVVDRTGTVRARGQALTPEVEQALRALLESSGPRP